MDTSLSTDLDGTPAELVPRLGGVPVSEPVTYRSLFVLEPLADWLAATAEAGLGEAAAPPPPERRELAGLLDPFDRAVTGVENEPCVGALLTHRQVWEQAGLGLGNLLHSVCLAPGEVTRVAVVDWSRRTSGSSSEAATQDESVSSDIAQGRAVTEAQQATAAELQNGGSAAMSSSVSAQAAAGGGGLLFSASGATASNASAAMTAQFSAGRRELRASSTNQVAQTTAEKAKSVRSRRATVVREVTEREAETTTARVLANYNRRHALNVEYFEVVMLYGTRTSLSDWQRCLFVPLRPLDFSDPQVLADRLRDLKALMTPEAGARLEAEVAAYRAFRAQPARDAGAEGRAAYLDAQARAREEAARALDRFSKGVAEAAKDWARVAELTRVWWEREAKIPSLGNAGTEGRLRDEQARAAGEALGLRARGTERHVAASAAYGAWRASAAAEPMPALDAKLAAAAAAFAAEGQDGAGYRGPELSAQVAAALDGAAGAFHDEAARLQQGAQGLRADLAKLRAEQLGGDAYIPEGPHPLIDALVADSLLWSQQLWLRADPARLHQMLSRHTVGGRAVGGLIDPHPVGVFGNFLAFRWGFARDEAGRRERDAFARRYILSEGGEGGDGEPDRDAVAATVAVPTTGVFAEAVLGRAGAAEKELAVVYGKWGDSVPPILPPNIADLASRDRGRKEPLDLSLKDFASALAALRATELGDVSHVGGIVAAAGKGDTFRDMGGIEQASAMLQKAGELTAAGANRMAEEVAKLQAQAQKFLVDALNTPAVQDTLKAVLPALLPASAVAGGAAAAAASGTKAAPPRAARRDDARGRGRPRGPGAARPRAPGKPRRAEGGLQGLREQRERERERARTRAAGDSPAAVRSRTAPGAKRRRFRADPRGGGKPDGARRAGGGTRGAGGAGAARDMAGWTLPLGNGAARNGSGFDLSEPASGAIACADGSVVGFAEIERVAW